MFAEAHVNDCNAGNTSLVVDTPFDFDWRASIPRILDLLQLAAAPSLTLSRSGPV